jgi:hypothetical protein
MDEPVNETENVQPLFSREWVSPGDSDAPPDHDPDAAPNHDPNDPPNDGLDAPPDDEFGPFFTPSDVSSFRSSTRR